jgi:hypothetical protein
MNTRLTALGSNTGMAVPSNTKIELVNSPLNREEFIGCDGHGGG